MRWLSIAVIPSQRPLPLNYKTAFVSGIRLEIDLNQCLKRVVIGFKAVVKSRLLC